MWAGEEREWRSPLDRGSFSWEVLDMFRKSTLLGLVVSGLLLLSAFVGRAVAQQNEKLGLDSGWNETPHSVGGESDITIKSESPEITARRGAYPDYAVDPNTEYYSLRPGDGGQRPAKWERLPKGIIIPRDAEVVIRFRKPDYVGLPLVVRMTVILRDCINNDTDLTIPYQFKQEGENDWSETVYLKPWDRAEFSNQRLQVRFQTGVGLKTYQLAPNTSYSFKRTTAGTLDLFRHP
jgi:hypothetical protein